MCVITFVHTWIPLDAMEPVDLGTAEPAKTVLLSLKGRSLLLFPPPASRAMISLFLVSFSQFSDHAEVMEN